MSWTRLCYTLAASIALLGSAGAAARPPVLCGDILNASVTLTQDVVCGPGVDGLTVDADNVRIEMNGYRIVGPMTIPWILANANYGVLSSGYSGVEIIGPGSIEGFDSPFRIEGGNGHQILDIDATRDGGLHAYLYDVSGSVVEGNTLTGIILSSTTGAPVVGNRIVGNRIGALLPTALWGGGWVLVHGCATRENVISDNKILENIPEDPLFALYPNRWANVMVSGGARNNVVANNRIYGSLAIRGASDNTIRENTIKVAGNAPTALGIYSAEPVASRGCKKGGWVSENNNIEGNNLAYGEVSVRLGSSSVPWPNQITHNFITGNTLGSPSVAGLRFEVGANSNDARGNIYQSVPSIAIDLGYRNLWP